MQRHTLHGTAIPANRKPWNRFTKSQHQLPSPGTEEACIPQLPLQLGWAHVTAHWPENKAWPCSLFTYHSKPKSHVLQLLQPRDKSSLDVCQPRGGEPLRKYIWSSSDCTIGEKRIFTCPMLRCKGLSSKQNPPYSGYNSDFHLDSQKCC